MATKERTVLALIEWTKKFYKLIHYIFSEFLNVKGKFEEACKWLDMNLSYDIKINDIKISIRVRKSDITFRDFTIRNTEYPKLVNKPTKYYFYAWTDLTDSVSQFIILDILKMQANKEFSKKRKFILNYDNTSFCYIPLSELESYIVLTNIKDIK